MNRPLRALLVAPPLDGPATGGTLYNRQLMAAIDSGVLALDHTAIDDLAQTIARVEPAALWVDSLYLRELPQLKAAAGPDLRSCLLLHYLPSLLERAPAARAALEAVERSALLAADWIVTPSSTMRGFVQALCDMRPCSVVEPGVIDREPSAPVPRTHSALMICNVTANKGVWPLLNELAARARAHDAFSLQIAGRLDLEPAYAERCQALVRDHVWLREHVCWLGGLSPHAVSERLLAASLLVSASRMESYGMALAEARAHGTPIVACAGGHIAAHVAADSGGELVEDEGALADALLALLRSPAELERRLQLAAANKRARSWVAAAREFEGVNAQLMAAGQPKPASR